MTAAIPHANSRSNLIRSWTRPDEPPQSEGNRLYYITGNATQTGKKKRKEGKRSMSLLRATDVYGVQQSVVKN